MRKTRARKAAPAIVIIVDEPAWRKASAAVPLIRRAARLTVTTLPASLLPLQGAGELTILLTDDARMRELNAQFRGKQRATNVLSFAGGEDGPNLGDIALGFGTVSHEARAQGKRFAAHAAHLAAHGVLHLLGYAHEKAKDAALMEALETALLARLGIPDPYAPRPKARKSRKPLK